LLKRLKEINSEEYWNVTSHAWGCILSLLGTVIMLRKATSNPNGNSLIAVSVFCLSLVLLFAASSSFHYYWDKPYRHKIRVLDHICIFYLIAGTYTPFMILLYDNEIGHFFLKALWLTAAFGTVFKFFFTGKYEYVSLALYLGMGWLVVLRFDALLEYTPFISLVFLILGGLSYSIGVYFYANDQKPYYHPIWHVFVLGGAFSHYLSIYFFL